MREVAAWPIPMLEVYCLVYRIDDAADQRTLLADLGRDPGVESAQSLGSFSTQAEASADAHYNDTYARLQRNLTDLAIPQAQRWSTGNGVRVAVIDTGVATDHADLRGRVTRWRNFIDDDVAQFRRDRHGTAVAGVIAALANNNEGIVGIAPEVELISYKACWEEGDRRTASCNTFTLAQALTAAFESRVDIVNLSLAGPSDPLLARIVKAAQRSGIIFVGAAAPGGRGFPVDVEGVIGVDAVESGQPGDDLLVAPGRDIFTLAPGGHYDAANGSSLAAAEVSAIIALLRARDSRLSATRAVELLKGSARAMKTASGAQHLINACEAMSSLTRGVSCAASSGSRQADAAGPRL
jgi:subtilisin family serine protease